MLNGWKRTALGELSKTTSGGTPSRKRKDYYDGTIPWVKSGELNDGYIENTDEHISELGLKNSSAKLFSPGTLLIALYGATVGKTSILRTSAATNQAVCGITPSAILDTEYLRYHLVFLRPKLLGYRYGGAQPNISQQIIRNLEVDYPPLSEQKKIAHILSTVQRTIEAQERLIQIITELKKALMQKLFTEGLRNEPQKQTEIGPIPESWEVVPLGELLSTAQYGTSMKGSLEGNCPILRMTNQIDGRIVTKNLQFVKINTSDLLKFKVERGDILFNRTNSLELVGRTAIHDINGDYVFSSYLIRLRTDETKTDPFFLNLDFNRNETQMRLKSIATRAVSQSNISANRLKGFPVPVPSLAEQGEIVSCASAFDTKLRIHITKLSALQDLFRTLLHNLMTAKTQVF